MKTAIVTGGSKGIGLAVVEALLARNWQVLTCARNEVDLARLEDRLGSARLGTLQADVSDIADCRSLPVEAVRRFGGIDAVVNNAGVYSSEGLAELSVEHWDQAMAVNLRAPMLLAQTALPWLARSGGVVVNIASTNGLMSEPGFAAYNASKAALISLTETMAVEWAHQGVRVNAIAPGWIRTPLSEPWLADLSHDQIMRLFPVGRVGTADEVAALTAYLCSDSGDYLTGATIRLDGGMLAQHPGI